MQFRMIPGALERLVQDASIADQLGEEAERLRRKVRAPSRMTLTTRSGVGRKGAFAQVVMRGPGAIAAEFGSRNNAPGAHLRSVLRGGR